MDGFLETCTKIFPKWRFCLAYYTDRGHIGFQPVKVTFCTNSGMRNPNLVSVLLQVVIFWQWPWNCGVLAVF